MRIFKPQNIIVLLLIITVFFTSSPYLAQANSNSDINIIYEFDNPPIYDDGRLLLRVRDMSDLFKFKIDWNATTKEITLIGVEHKINLTVGKNIATVNEKQIKLDVAPKIVDGYTYVPLRFVAEAFGAEVYWNQESKTVDIDYRSQYIMSTIGNTTYWMDRNDGTLYFAEGTNNAEEFVRLNMEINDKGDLIVEEIDDNYIFVTVRDNYGWTNPSEVTYKAFINDGKIMHDTKVEYNDRKIGANIDKYNDNYVMTDGRKVYIVNNSGEIINTLDLVELGGEEGLYSIEAITDEYILIRPYNTGLLTLINLETTDKVLLYQVLLNQKDIEYIETHNIQNGYGDNLIFTEQRGEVLYFTYRTFFDYKEVIYQYKWK